ncbi:general secretion pathway protein H [Calothrix parasitica NIES-267]|uniref:General secretion pathway protein H n=1 Tax=Calothrix parasitica NIES-267 TaxID=1973488 RepID=A0A1Z4M0P1_9CYAN|nr:general secretion pathway protein H [Calothrix parasitica NIES-267]
MKTNWKLAFGITGIGLLLILGVMIAPVFLSRPDGPARVQEGPTVIGSMNRAQQAYFLDNNKFTQNFGELGLGIKPETDEYIYKINLKADSQSVMHIGEAKRKNLKSYVGFIYVITINGEAIPAAKLCETKQPLTKTPQMPKSLKDANDFANIEDIKNIKCPSGFKSLNFPQFYNKAI